MLSERKKVCGIDPHKKMCAAVVIQDKPIETLAQLKFENNRQGLDRLLKTLTETDCNTVVIETTNTFWQGISRALMQRGYNVIPISPQTVPKKSEKNDFLDASWLAITYLDERVKEAYFAPPAIQKLRSLLRTRHMLVRTRTMYKNRLKAELSRAGLHLSNVVTDVFGKRGTLILKALATEGIDGIRAIEDNSVLPKDVYVNLLKALDKAFMENFDAQVITVLLLSIENLNKTIKMIDGFVNELLHNEPELLKTVKLIMTIPGIALTTATTVVAEVGDFRRFASGKKIAKWAGLVPRMRESGGKTYYGRITKRGSPFVRWILYEAATSITTTKKPARLYEFYRRIAIRRGTKIARVALARKLLVTIHAMVVKDEQYIDARAYSNTYERKMYLLELERRKHRERLMETKEELTTIRLDLRASTDT